MKKVLFIFGTRPEAIKLVNLINIFKKDKINFKTFILVTAQHREMLDQVLSLFNIKPDFDLNIMSPDQTLEQVTLKILKGVSEVLDIVKPDLIFVQGDTTTTFVSSLASFYKKIPLAHVEAGLRTENKYSPFPEEINRRMTSVIAEYHFPPTNLSERHLLDEGIESKSIFVTGNTVIDALMYISSKLDHKSEKQKNLFSKKYSINFKRGKKFILVTCHRRESFGEGFLNICEAIKAIAKKNKNVEFIFPVHLNPNVQRPVFRLLNNVQNIKLIPPQEYVPFIFLMKNSYLILTDSGGVQEEAPSLGKPVLIMRNNTERPEGVIAGTSILVGTETKKIISEVEELLNNKTKYKKIANSANPYGDGNSSQTIYEHIFKIFYR